MMDEALPLTEMMLFRKEKETDFDVMLLLKKAASSNVCARVC